MITGEHLLQSAVSISSSSLVATTAAAVTSATTSLVSNNSPLTVSSEAPLENKPIQQQHHHILPQQQQQQQQPNSHLIDNSHQYYRNHFNYLQLNSSSDQLNSYNKFHQQFDNQPNRQISSHYQQLNLNQNNHQFSTHQNHHHHHQQQQQQQQQQQASDQDDPTRQLDATTLANTMAIVRDTVVQHLETYLCLYMILSIFIGILIYFIYYFTIIAQRPKLITNGGSKFGQFVKENFNDVLSRRFYPIFFWWGCNFQTALFGYYQGIESEVPRDEFLRQYLDVSDEQYYVSNVDLSEFFQDNIVPLPSKFSLSTDINQQQQEQCQQHISATTSATNVQQPPQQQYRQNLANNNCINEKKSSTKGIPSKKSNDSTKAESLHNQLINNNIDAKHLPSNQHKVVLKPWKTKNCSSLLSKSNCNINLSQESMTISNSQLDTDSKPSSQLSSSLSSSLSSMQDDSGIETVRYHYNSDRCSDKYNSNQSDDSSGKDSDKDIRTTKDHYMNNMNRHNKHVARPRVRSIVATNVDNSNLIDKRNSIDTKRATKTRYPQNQHKQRQQCQQQQQPQSQQASMTASSSSSSSLTTSEAPENCHIEINNSCQSEECGCMQTLYTPKHQFIEYGQCAIDWYKTSHKNYHDNQLVALISAGMTTGSDKIYVTETAKCLNELGYEVCVFIRRGVGGLTLKSARFFSPTKWKDFEAAVESIKLQRPNAKIVAIGFSFGAIELCRYLSMTGNKSLVSAAMLISCPYNPEAGGRNMRKKFLNRCMDSYLARYLGKMLYLPLKNKAMLDGSRCRLDFSVLPKLQSLYDFEINFNRVVQYYPTTEAYAKDSILTDVIANIQVPTLCLSSSDDFMATKQMLPLAQLAQHDKMAMILTRHGGHMAFVDGIWPKAPFLGQRVLTRYLKVLRNSPYLSQHPTRWKETSDS